MSTQLEPITQEVAIWLTSKDRTREERIEAGRQHFGAFFTYYFADYVNYPFAPFHQDMFQDCHDLLEGELRELLWLMFRESAKTSIAKGLIVYLICYDLAKYINVDSYDKTNSERILFDVVLELQTNPRILEDFGNLYNSKRSPDEATQKRVSDFLTNRIEREDGTVKESIRVEAHSTQESVRGRLSGANRPDFLLMDDFETNRTKDSLASTENVKEHIAEFYGGLAGNAKILYLGNYITEYGTIQSLLDRSKSDKRLRVRNVPIASGVELAQWPNCEITGVPAWPEKYCMTPEEAKRSSKVSIEDKRKQMHTDERGDADFLAEMMNSPVDFTTQEFKRDWFKYITMKDLAYHETALYITIDTAVKDKEGNDDTGFAMNWVNKEGRWHVKTWGEHINSKGLVDKIFSLWAMYKPVCIYVEETAFYTAIEPFLKMQMEIRNEFPIVRPVTTQGRAKELRIRNLIPRYETGMIYHIEGMNSKLEDQLLRFPKAKHDDIMDALAYQCDVAKAPRERERKNRAYEQESHQEEELLHPDIGI